MDGETVEIWLKHEDEGAQRPFYREFFTVGFGDRKIEVTCAETDLTASRWVNSVKREHGKRGPLLAGICTFLGEPSWCRRSRAKAMKESCPIALMSICVFGSRCLLVPIDDYGYGYRPFSFAVRSFLADPRLRLVGIGVRKLAEKMDRDWAFRVNIPSELRPLVEAAFGMEAVKKTSTRRGRVGLEQLARVALGGIRVRKKPGKLLYNPWWLNPEDNDDEVMHATVDAYMAYQIGARSLEMIHGRR